MSPGSPSFADLRRAADGIKGSQSPSRLSNSLSQHIPTSFTWHDLASELARPDDLDKPRQIHALRACLEAEPSRLQVSSGRKKGGDEDDAAARRQIRRFVARSLSPVLDDEEYDEELAHGDDTRDRRAQVVRRCQSVAVDGLAVLQRVGLPAPDEDGTGEALTGDSAQVLYTVTALADAGQPWTTDAAAAAAGELLTNLFEGAEKSQWIVDGILKQYLRPLFARSRPATVTESGRKAVFGGGGGGGARDTANAESPKAKPWKYIDLRAISVFAWAIHEADGPLVRSHWPLFTPVLLALVDDPDTAVRARGLVLLRAFVAAVPDGGSLLHTTGLDSVLADAVFPTLLFLPRLTPEKESLQLLAPAYAALLSLASAAAAAGNSSGRSRSTPAAKLPPKAAADLLDRVLRDGIYAGYFHASEHIRIVEELVRQAGHVVQAMGVYAVKHLKDLLPMYAAIIADPFAMRYKPAVAAAVDALQTTIATCWPRLANTPWQEEILKMLMLCWLNAEEDAGQGEEGGRKRPAADLEATDDVKARLVRAAGTQLAVMRAAGVDAAAKVGPLVAKEPRLKALFQIDQAKSGAI